MPAGMLLALATVALLSGCGKTGAGQVAGGGPLRRLAPIEAEGAVSLTTRNTARIGGADTIVDAAAVARAVYPGLTAGTRPQAVVLVNRRDWPAALAASALAGAPIGAPILYVDGHSLPAVSRQALEAMHPSGLASLGGAQVIAVGVEVAVPKRYSVHALAPADPAGTAAEVEQLLATVRGTPPRQAIAVNLSSPLALQMPAAGLSAVSGAPIVFASGGSLPAATAALLRSMHRPSIYAMGPAGMGAAALGGLARLGSVARIAAANNAEEGNAVENSIAVSRFTDGVFGWGVKEPGHGLVFADARRPLDAPAAALLSATGDYGPMLLLQGPDTIAPALSAYLGDIQPAYSSAPEFSPQHGVYNHGWLIGDERAISLVAQAELDSLLEISPRKQGGSEEASVLAPE